MALLPFWAGLARKILGQAPLKKGPPHALSNAVRWPKMAHCEGVSRTGPRNRNLLVFRESVSPCDCLF